MTCKPERWTRNAVVFLGTLGLLLLCFRGVNAQVTTAEVVGTVTDPTSAIVPGAQIKVVNNGTGAVYATVTSGTGDFDITKLQVGSYTITITARGFKTFVAHVALASGDHARISPKLQVGTSEQTVTVQALTPALQTQVPTVSTLIDDRLTQDLPLNGRNVTNLIQLAAGVTFGLPNAMNSGTRLDDRRLSSSYSANGQSDQLNNNMIDGMDNNERFIGAIGPQPSIDAIQEVKVMTSLDPAGISRSGGAVVNLITKSGTNQFHGTLYEFLRNDVTDARNYFATVGHKPSLRQNQFGGSLGGPIVRNKAFFFGDYEDFRLVEGVTAVSTVPTLFEEQNPGNFTDLGPTCPNVSSKVVKGSIGYDYFALYPAPNQPGVASVGTCAPPTNNFNFSSGQTQDVATYDSRVDYHLPNNDSFYARYDYNSTNAYIPGILPVTTVAGVTVNPGGGRSAAAGGNSDAGPAADQETSAALSYTHILNINSMIDFNAEYMRINDLSGTVNEGKDISNAFGFPCNSVSCVNLPGDTPSSGLMSIDMNGQPYAPLGDAWFSPLLDQENMFQYTGNYSLLKGQHSFKFGFSVIRRQASEAQSRFPRGDASANGNITGNVLADLLEGYVTGVSRVNTITTAALRTWEDGYYAQDDYRMKPNLTLNLGVRYDMYTPFTSANYGFSNFDPNLGLLIGPGLPGAQQSNATAGVMTDHGDIAPRLGLEYDAGHGFVARTGYGITYFPDNNTSVSLMSNAPYTYSFSCGRPPFESTACTGAYASPIDGQGWNMAAGIPVPSSNMALATNPANYIGTRIESTDFNYKNGMLQQWSLNLEKAFAGNVLTVAYVGNHGSRLATDSINENQPATSTSPYPFPNLPGVTIRPIRSVLWSNYNALQTTLERRLKAGLAANINFTWSHNTTNAMVMAEGQNVGECVGQCLVDNGHGQGVTYNSYYQYDYGNADLDTRNRFAATVTYNEPFGNNLRGAAGIFARGWTTNAIYFANTGNPITVSNADGSRSGIPGLGADNPNFVRGNSSGFHRSINEWYDVTQFHLQAAGMLGDEARNQIYGPGSQALALSLFKNIPIHENCRAEFRLESFNLFNTPTFGEPGNTIFSYDANNVGTNAGGPASITSTPFDAPARQLQGAIKIIF